MNAARSAGRAVGVFATYMLLVGLAFATLVGSVIMSVGSPARSDAIRR